MAKGAGVTKAAIKLFGQTANNLGAIEPFAHHDEQGWTPRPIP